jgi:hypothetical protein
MGIFNFSEYSEIQFEDIFKVIEGKQAGSLFRNVIDPEACAQIAKNYWNSEFLQKRKEVESPYLGTYHFMRELPEYFEEAKKNIEIENSLFDGVENILGDFINKIALEAEKRGYRFRMAQYGKQSASRLLVRSWHGMQEYALEPHDDYYNCIPKNNEDFEIKEVLNHSIVAVNLCVENTLPDVGELLYWNLKLTQEEREKYQTSSPGYGYPNARLVNVDKISKPIRAGDIYLFDGYNIHAVGPSRPGHRRVTLSFLMGFNNQKEIIYWT